MDVICSQCLASIAVEVLHRGSKTAYLACGSSFHIQHNLMVAHIDEIPASDTVVKVDGTTSRIDTDGIIVRDAADCSQAYRAGVVEESDRGHAFF